MWKILSCGVVLAGLAGCQGDVVLGEDGFGVAGESGAPTGVGSIGGPPGGQTVQAGQLTAGEWRDLDHWDFWLDITGQGPLSGIPQGWGFHLSQRYPVVVQDHLGEPVLDAEVVLLDAFSGAALWTARTDNKGEAELFDGIWGTEPAPLPWIEVRHGDQLKTLETPRLLQSNIVTLDGGPVSDTVDLMWVVDATGSMDDELRYLQAELLSVLERIEVEHADVDLRVGQVYYRDVGDVYVVRSEPFTTDLDAVSSFMAQQSAAGGGDWPEALALALEEATLQAQWSSSARARLMFVLLDAPPHDQDRASVQASVERAAALGIRIVPVGASGVDLSAEGLLRSMDIATGGTYTFLTDDSGIGNSHMEPTVGDYQVEFLNDLLVRIVSDAVTMGDL